MTEKVEELFRAYRDGSEVTLGPPNISVDEIARRKSYNVGVRPYPKREAELYRQRWQNNIKTNPRCKPPHAFDKD